MAIFKSKGWANQKTKNQIKTICKMELRNYCTSIITGGSQAKYTCTIFRDYVKLDYESNGTHGIPPMRATATGILVHRTLHHALLEIDRVDGHPTNSTRRYRPIFHLYFVENAITPEMTGYIEWVGCTQLISIPDTFGLALHKAADSYFWYFEKDSDIAKRLAVFENMRCNLQK